MMILIIGFTCPLSIKLAIERATSVITKCDSFFYYKVRQLFYKVRRLVQSATEQTGGKIVL